MLTNIIAVYLFLDFDLSSSWLNIFLSGKTDTKVIQNNMLSLYSFDKLHELNLN